MRKLTTIVILLTALYFAGMNEHSSVIAAVISAVLIMIISFIFSRVMKYKIDLYIPPQKNIVYKNIENTLIISAKNQSRLPLNYFSVNIAMKYKTDKKGVSKKLSGGALGKNSGDTESAFYYTAPCCGLIDVSLKKVRVSDYFGLFSSSKKLKNQTGEIYVFPQPKELKFMMNPFGAYTNQEETETSSDKKGDDNSEIHVIREYQSGDLMRHIHQNFSAKTGKLWIKEYSKENDYIIDFVIDTSGEKLDTELLDVLYELIFCITDSIIKEEAVIRLYWYDREIMGMRKSEVSDRESLLKTMTEIYRSDLQCSTEEYSLSAGKLGEKGMIINAKLDWYFLGKPVYSFDKEKTESELLDHVFDLRR